MKASMEIDIKQGYVAMAAFIVHTSAKMLAHLKDSKGKGNKTEGVYDQTGAKIGSWSIVGE